MASHDDMGFGFWWVVAEHHSRHGASCFEEGTWVCAASVSATNAPPQKLQRLPPPFFQSPKELLVTAQHFLALTCPMGGRWPAMTTWVVAEQQSTQGASCFEEGPWMRAASVLANNGGHMGACCVGAASVFADG